MSLCSVPLTKYYFDDKVKKTEMGKTCRIVGDSRSAYKVLVGKPEGRESLGGLRRMWEDNIKMDF